MAPRSLVIHNAMLHVKHWFACVEVGDMAVTRRGGIGAQESNCRAGWQHGANTAWAPVTELSFR